jgi:hypothetical protein
MHPMSLTCHDLTMGGEGALKTRGFWGTFCDDRVPESLKSRPSNARTKAVDESFKKKMGLLHTIIHGKW